MGKSRNGAGPAEHYPSHSAGWHLRTLRARTYGCPSVGIAGWCGRRVRKGENLKEAGSGSVVLHLPDPAVRENERRRLGAEGVLR